MTGSTEITAAREGARDLIAHIILRCGGRPDGSMVAVSFTGAEDVADDHPLAVVDLSTSVPDRPAAETVAHLRRAVAEAGAERVALVAFDHDVPQMTVLTGLLAVTVGLPTQRLLVADDIWLDPDNPSVSGAMAEIYASRAAVSAVLDGVVFPVPEMR
ncbi:hypothetical protein CHO01_00010 [Cellulomonas hominis]|uniref:Uncharacterized protein n=1 Tax=Cellulomonas hominis TaxID=156981 RepID=A0A511F6F6_9CELL|nr:hypothetical protein [Cellulomonas hominis]MBB5474860.1 hypothetical protein [Cellulomonas hominis]NKY05934.1 hypothetical protein [Cellulomonas hominis]GEL44885.1 hypothetical protein CHO01_00010 [Cellulomonas hominis]